MNDPRRPSVLIGESVAAAHHRDVIARRALLAGVASFALTALALVGGFVLPAAVVASVWATVGVLNLVAIAVAVAGVRGARWEETRESHRVALNTLAAVTGLACAVVAFVAVLVARLAV